MTEQTPVPVPSEQVVESAEVEGYDFPQSVIPAMLPPMVDPVNNVGHELDNLADSLSNNDTLGNFHLYG
jgi:hypothetical protein